MAKTITGVITWLKGWFYDKDEITSKEQALQTQINNKASQADLNTTNTNVNNLDSKLATLSSRLDDVESLEFIKIVSDKGTASASTMNALYVETKNNKIDFYYTVKNGSSYGWKNIDADILSDLSIDWSDIENKPFSTIDTALTSGSNNPVTNGVLYKALNNKSDKEGGIAQITGSGRLTYIDTDDEDTQKQINYAIDDELESMHHNMQDCIIDVQLVPKSTNSSGAIIFSKWSDE